HGKRAYGDAIGHGGNGERRRALLYSRGEGVLRAVRAKVARFDGRAGYGGELRHSPGSECGACGKGSRLALRTFDELKQAAAIDRRHERLYRTAAAAAGHSRPRSTIGALLFAPEWRRPDL